MKLILEYLFLGFIQGITEPIPVSSSGHLLIFKILLEKFLKLNVNIDFEALATITNFGSFIAIVLIFWDDIISLIKNFFGYLKTKDVKLKNDYKYCWYIVIGTIPAGIMGLVVSKLDLFDKLEENAKFVGGMLLVTALFLFLIRNFVGTKSKDEMTFKDAIVIGLTQICALLPGISRSGSTIVGGMFSGLKRETAFKYSFMLYIPISIATMLLGVLDLMEAHVNLQTWFFYLISAEIAGVFTYYSTKWFSKIVKEGKLIYFSIYCVIVGILCIIFL